MSENAVAKTDEKKPTSLFSFSDFESAYAAAEKISKSELIPTAYRGKPTDITIAWEFGGDLGLKPLQSLKSVCVINGSPTIWGDAALAIVIPKPDYEYCKETFDEATMTARCEAKRRGEPAKVSTFSKKDAEIAGLWGVNTWKKYPKRMLQMRARGFALRDTFPHHLKGIYLAEEMIDERTPIDGGEIPAEPVKAAMLPIGEEEDDASQEAQQASEPSEADAAAPEPMPTEDEKKALWVAAKSLGITEKDLLSAVKEALGYPPAAEFTMDKISQSECREATTFFIEQIKG